MLDTNQRPHSIVDLIEELNKISEEDLDDSASLKKKQLLENPFKDALFSELCTIKRRVALSARTNTDDLSFNDPQLMRLDNMLLAEGVVGSERPHSSDSSEKSDYNLKLTQIREEYQQKMAWYDETLASFLQKAGLLLQKQQENRPITQQEVERFLSIIRRKIAAIQIQLKQSTCENIMTLRTRFLDARRKRRNFSKQATEILNQYFMDHISNPYPTEDEKEELARRCHISVAQVSNWFGNKRIRYKKSLPRMSEEMASQAAAAQANQQYEMFNAAAAASAIMNPYAAAGMFPMVNPELYSQMNLPNPNSNNFN